MYQKTLLGDMGAQLTYDNSQSIDTTMQSQIFLFNVFFFYPFCQNADSRKNGGGS